MNVTFSGKVAFRENGALAADVPLELLIIDKDVPFDRSNPLNRIVLVLSNETDLNGNYLFTVSKSELPKNAAYVLKLTTNSLLQVNKMAVFPCMAGDVIYGDVNASQIINLVTVDHPTYFQVSFDKIDHTSTDKVELSICFIPYETSMEVPDTTITRRLPFSYFKKFDLYYTIIKETGEFQTNQIHDIVLVKNDTTKILVEY